MTFTVVRQDITAMHVDAIVNAANPYLQEGGGVCGAIFAAAGRKKLRAACEPLAPVPTGHAVITPGFKLPAKFVIHAVGPIYDEWTPEQARELLYSAYAQSLRIAVDNKCKSIAFPLISSGIYGYPKKEAFAVARQAILDFLESHEIDVYLAVFDKAAVGVNDELLRQVNQYLDENYIPGREGPVSASGFAAVDYDADFSDSRESEAAWPARIAAKSIRPLYGEIRSLGAGVAVPSKRGSKKVPAPLAKDLDQLETFFEFLDKLRKQKQLDDVTLYQKANLNKKLFSKIKTNPEYTPKKPTIIAFAFALRLNVDETKLLLEHAGYTLSRYKKFDVIVEFFIRNQLYDIYDINDLLWEFGLPTLGSVQV